MVLHRKLFLQVPFDPYGTRGEDDDYVLNARYCGFPFFFDKNLLLLHLPPQRNGSYWTRQRQDIQRFRYIREKVRMFGFDPKILGSFLEYFTQEDLEFKAVSSSIKAALTFIDSNRPKAWNSQQCDIGRNPLPDGGQETGGDFPTVHGSLENMHAENIQASGLELEDLYSGYQKITFFVSSFIDCTVCLTDIIHSQPEVFQTPSSLKRTTWKDGEIPDLELAMGSITRMFYITTKK